MACCGHCPSGRGSALNLSLKASIRNDDRRTGGLRSDWAACGRPAVLGVSCRDIEGSDEYR